MKENVDINNIAALAKLSLSESECVRSAEEILAFTQYVQILKGYCDGYTAEQTAFASDSLREDTPCANDGQAVFDGYVSVPLAVGGEE